MAWDLLRPFRKAREGSQGRDGLGDAVEVFAPIVRVGPNGERELARRPV